MHLLRKTLFLLLLIASSYTIKGQNQNLKSENQDLIVTLKESVLNKMFKAIGEIKGTSIYSFMFIEGTYEWTVINPQIQLHQNKADFFCDVKVKIGKFDYTTKVKGIVEICYDQQNNLIMVEITQAKFPLNMMFMGQLRHLWDVDLVKYFETPFMFEGPLTMGTEMDFSMPDGSIKKVYCHPLNCGVKIAEKQAIVSAEVEFVERPTTPNTQKK